MDKINQIKNQRNISVSVVSNLKTCLEKAEILTSYKDNKDDINLLKDDVLNVIGSGYWAPALLRSSIKRDLLKNIKSVCERLIERHSKQIIKHDKDIEINTPKKLEGLSLIENLIGDDKTKLIGKGEVVKDSWYEVHEYENKLYSVILYDSQSHWILEDSVKLIEKDEITKYI